MRDTADMVPTGFSLVNHVSLFEGMLSEFVQFFCSIFSTTPQPILARFRQSPQSTLVYRVHSVHVYEL